MFGMKWPVLSSTATSTLMVSASLWKLGAWGRDSFLLNLDGIFGSCVSGSAAGASFLLRGLATVSPESFFGPSCAMTKPARRTTNAANQIFFIAGVLEANYTKEGDVSV